MPADPPKTRLLIVDDHPIIQEGMLFLLADQPDLEIVGTALTARDGLRQLRRLRPDMVVVDLALPDMNGIHAIGIYLAEMPRVAVVVFSGKDDEPVVFQALQAGARGYVLKGSPLQEVASAIREVRQGGFWLSARLNPAIIKTYLAHHGQTFEGLSEYGTLSERERQVFLLLAGGRETDEIADLLHISPKTVAKHRMNVKQKLHLRNEAQMANYAHRMGLL